MLVIYIFFIFLRNWSSRRLPMHISTLLPIGHGVDRKAAIEAVNEELTALCSNFGTDHDAVTGCLVSQVKIHDVF